MTDRLPDAQEVAEWLNVPVSWVRESTRSGALPCVELGRYRRYERAAIEEWLKSCEARRSRWHSRRVKVGSGAADQPAPHPGRNCGAESSSLAAGAGGGDQPAAGHDPAAPTERLPGTVDAELVLSPSSSVGSSNDGAGLPSPVGR